MVMNSAVGLEASKPFAILAITASKEYGIPAQQVGMVPAQVYRPVTVMDSVEEATIAPKAQFHQLKPNAEEMMSFVPPAQLNHIG
jgi:hypothetical protein